MTTCHRQICPHMHFNKCYNQRIRSIPVSFFPDPTIDSFSNVNVKCAKQFKSNIPTVAYQKYTFGNEATNDERNFIKDFYMENYQQQKMVLTNNIVDQLKEELYQNSAYVLAEGATKDYEAFQSNKKKALINARTRAKSAYQAHFNHQKQQKQKKFQENGYWLKKLFRKLQQIAKNIIQESGQNESERQKQFLLSKPNLTANFLAQIKIRDPKSAHDILEQLKILMQKKKLKFSDQRQEQQLNKSVTQSFSSQASENTSQNSMLSEVTQASKSNAFGENQIVDKFWNFDELKKKWKLQDIQNVREMIRRVLARKIVFDAQIQAVKQRRAAQKNNLLLLKTKEKMKQKKQTKKDIKSIKNKETKDSANKNIENQIERKQASSGIKLSKQEQSAKKGIIQGGRFDAIGQKFLRNKAYSDIFKNKQNEIKAVFIAKQSPQITSKQTKQGKVLATTNITLSK